MLKIKGMTLQEMIVVLILTSLIIGIGFSVLSLVRKQLWGIEKHYQSNTKVNILRQALWTDFNMLSSADYNNSEGILKLYNEMKIVTYKFEKELVIRDKDTFNIGLTSYLGLLHNKKVAIGQIDALKIELTKGLGITSIFVYKENTASFYMNQ